MIENLNPIILCTCVWLQYWSFTISTAVDKIIVPVSNCKKYDRAIDFVYCLLFIVPLSIVVRSAVNVTKSVRILLLLLYSTCKKILCFLLQVLQESHVHFLFRCPLFRQLKYKPISCICAIHTLRNNFLNSAHCGNLYDLLHKEQGIWWDCNTICPSPLNWNICVYDLWLGRLC